MRKTGGRGPTVFLGGGRRSTPATPPASLSPPGNPCQPCYLRRVEVRSLGYRTDLAILALEGSQVTDQGDHLVIRTAGNPDYWWGNFLLLRDLNPGAGAGGPPSFT